MVPVHMLPAVLHACPAAYRSTPAGNGHTSGTSDARLCVGRLSLQSRHSQSKERLASNQGIPVDFWGGIREEMMRRSMDGRARADASRRPSLAAQRSGPQGSPPPQPVNVRASFDVGDLEDVLNPLDEQLLPQLPEQTPRSVAAHPVSRTLGIVPPNSEQSRSPRRPHFSESRSPSLMPLTVSPRFPASRRSLAADRATSVLDARRPEESTMQDRVKQAAERPSSPDSYEQWRAPAVPAVLVPRSQPAQPAASRKSVERSGPLPAAPAAGRRSLSGRSTVSVRGIRVMHSTWQPLPDEQQQRHCTAQQRSGMYNLYKVVPQPAPGTCRTRLGLPGGGSRSRAPPRTALTQLSRASRRSCLRGARRAC